MAEPETSEQVVAKKSKKPLIIAVAGVVVLAVVVVGVLFLTGILGGGTKPAAGESAADPGHAAKPAEPMAALPTVALEPFVVNLADADQVRFLKVTLSIELTSKELEKQMEQLTSKIRDAVITLLSSRTYTQIRDSKGKLKLKQDLTIRLNEILGTNAVSDVLFTDFIIS